MGRKREEPFLCDARKFWDFWTPFPLSTFSTDLHTITHATSSALLGNLSHYGRHISMFPERARKAFSDNSRVTKSLRRRRRPLLERPTGVSSVALVSNERTIFGRRRRRAVGKLELSVSNRGEEDEYQFVTLPC